MDRTSAWQRLSSMQARINVGRPGSRLASGPGWSATLSGTTDGELNVCCVSAEATADGIADLLAIVGELPVLVFTDSHAVAAREALVSAGFSVADTTEPLMESASVPVEAPGTFAIERVDTPAALAECLSLTADAHHVDLALLDQTLGTAARSWRASLWLARNVDGVAVSSVALVRVGSTIGVAEMMTPPQFQRIGAGRALLTTALARSWDEQVSSALLLATPAGRRLYESLGFIALDESVSCYRGIDDDVLAAIGQGS